MMSLKALANLRSADIVEVPRILRVSRRSGGACSSVSTTTFCCLGRFFGFFLVLALWNKPPVFLL
jgi:hypothetical protein